MYPLKQSTAITIPFFAFDSAGVPVTGKVTGDWTKRISKASGAFAAMTVTVTEKEGGWYDLVMDTGHTDTIGLLSVYLTCTGVMQVNFQWRVTVAGVGADLTHIDGLATNANLATLNLKKLNVVNSAGDAIVASSTGSDGHGVNASGNGTGVGVKALGGATGEGIAASGGATAAAGIRTTGTSTLPGFAATSPFGHGILAAGGDNGAGISATGGALGHGMHLAGGATSGDGLRATVTSGVELRALPSALVVTNGGSNTASFFKTDRTETGTNHWKDALLKFTSGALKGQVKKVSAYNGTTKEITVSAAFTGIPADGVSFDLVNQ